VRRVTSLASSAFPASVAATDTLQQQLLFRSSITGTTDASVSMVRDEWSSAYATDCPTGPAATKQSTWDRAVTALERQTVINSLSNATDELGCCQLHYPTAVTGCTHFHCPAAACDSTTAPSTSLLDFDWEQTHASLTSALAERLLTQEDCMVCRAEGATVALQGITA